MAAVATTRPVITVRLARADEGPALNYHDLSSYRRYVLAHWTDWVAQQTFVFRDGHTVTTILHRDGPFQTERVDMAPYVDIEPHCHPHIDSLEYYLAGTACIRIRHRQFQLRPSAASRLCLPILHNTWHSGVVGPEGLSFLSIQQWLVTPTSATQDWLGGTA